MTFLPIVERELRVTARRKATYRTRFVAALSMLAVWVFLLSTNRYSARAERSQIMFIALGVLALGFAMLAGVFLTADCLSEEKREETLGLLFLTDLRGYDVVFGKLAATSLHAFYGLLATFPMLALPVLMGGVTGAAFWRTALSLVLTLLLSLSLGLCVSALSREARQAMAGTFGIMLLLAGVCPTLYWLLSILFPRAWATALLLPSPGFTLLSALDDHYTTFGRRPLFWDSLAVVGGLAVLFFLLAVVALPHTWQTRPRRPKAAPPRERLGFADPAEGRNLRARVRLGLNPFQWLASRQSGLGKTGGRLARLVLALWSAFVVISIASRSHVPAFVVVLFSSFALHVVLKCLLALEVTGQLSEDRRSGALELLLVTPLRESELLVGQAWAVFERFRGWVVTLVFVNLGVMAQMALFSKRLQIVSRTDLAIFEGLFCGGILVLAADCLAMPLVGMWMALRARKHHRAVLGTIACLLLPSWVAAFLLVFFMRLAQGLSEGEVATLFAAWFGLGLLVDGIMASMAYFGLRRGLRTLVSEGK